MTVAEYIKQLLSFEEYSFSLNELQRELSRSETSIRSELSRPENFPFSFMQKNYSGI